MSSTGHPSRQGPVSGIFIITRDGDTTNSLNINFAVGGTAVYGADYVVSGATSFNGTSGTATIPAGAESVTLTITPNPGSTNPIAQDVQLTLTNSANLSYLIGTPNTASLTIDSPAPPWLVLLYMSGDDTAPQTNNGARVSLSEPINQLIGRLSSALPSNPAMRLVVLKDGNAAGDSQLYVRDPAAAQLEPVPPQFRPAWFPANRELDMGKVSTLQQFIRWARETFPGSDSTMLSIIDHGGGWAPDFGPVPQPSSNGSVQAGGWRGMSLDMGSSKLDPVGGAISSLSTKNTGEVFAGLGDLGKFDVLFYDACLMGMVETAYEVQPYAKYFIAGQNELWANLPYERYLAPSVQLPDHSHVPMLDAGTTPRQLAQRIVQQYNQPYLPDNDNQPFTISAIDMGKLPDLKNKTDALAGLLYDILTSSSSADVITATNTITNAYRDAQKFDYDSNLRLDATDGYVDLADFAAQLRAESDRANVQSAAQAVFDAIAGQDAANRVVIETQAVSDTVKNLTDPITTTASQPLTWSFPRARGLSIYLPLGEEDCRPTGLKNIETPVGPKRCLSGGAPDPVSGFGMERQLAYYSDPSQLRFTSEAPHWSELLQWLDEHVHPDAKIGRFQSPFQVSNIVSHVLLPFVTLGARASDPGTDLMVAGSPQIVPATPQVGQPVEIKVTIKNVGSADITKPFWVDLYIDPKATPSFNHLWPELSRQGVAWRVYGLGAGQSVTLSTLHPNDPRDPSNRYSEFSAFIRSGARQLYVLVDSYADGRDDGAVGEDNEQNNLHGPTVVQVGSG